jgi:histidine triad (HIT) family protein
MSSRCEFCQIIRGEQPARIVGETAGTLAFFPLNPVSIGHTLIIPKAHVTDLWSADPTSITSLMQEVVRAGKAIKRALNPDGMNLISSSGKAASQTIRHLHLHIVPRWEGDHIGHIWPPSKPLASEAQDQAAESIRLAYAAISAGLP